MSEKESWYEADIGICGRYRWTIFSPVVDVVIKFEAATKRWEQAAHIPALREDDGVVARRLKKALQRIMYPVRSECRLWLEDAAGQPIAAKLASEPAFVRKELIKVTRGYKDRREIEWLGDRSSLTHKIHMGNGPSGPVMWDVPANLWPPTIFFVGNNQVQAFPLKTLTETFLRPLCARLRELAQEFAQYERACYFLTSSDKPPILPF